MTFTAHRSLRIPAFLLALILGLPTFAAAQELDFSRLDYATVRVFAIQDIGTAEVRGASEAYQLAVPQAGHGSGVIISADGLILTAEHVVHGARRVAVKVTGSDRAIPATVLHADAEKDFAFLAVDGRYEHFVPFPNVSPRLAVRQTVNAIGYPLDADRETPQSSQGIVSGKADDNRLQLSMAVNPGNSGGPLVNEREELIGVVVARGNPEQGVQGIAVAVPLDMMRATYKSLVVQDGLLAAARIKLASLPNSETVAASVVTRLVQIGAVGGVMDEVAKQLASGSAGTLRAEIDSALRDGGANDPDVLAIAAAYLWNAAIWMKEKQQGDPAHEVTSARNLCQQAVNLDAGLPQRSRFVAYVLANNQPWGVRPVAQLQRAATASIVKNEGIPTVSIRPSFGAQYMTSLLGLDVSLDLHLGQKAHVHAEYVLGLGVPGINHTIELYGGYAIASWKSKTQARFLVGSASAYGGRVMLLDFEENTVDVESALIIEGGILGTIADATTCHSRCMDETLDEGPTTVTAFAAQVGAGVRFVQAYAATRSDGLRARDAGTYYAHVLLLPFGLPADDYNLRLGLDEEDNDATSAIGAEIGTIQGTGLGTVGIGLGYLPAISNFVLRVTWGADIWL